MNTESDQNQQTDIDNIQMSAKKTMQVFTQLCNSMPAIGFISRKKRLSAFVSVTSKAQSLLDTGEVTEDEVLFVLSMIVRKRKDFQKAAMMAAFSLPNVSKGILLPIGFKFANQIRLNMGRSLVDDPESVE